jgi:ADP-dependent NAD(P)H-hydrate dehydratase / NAD(P)H-hydrate epimerase
VLDADALNQIAAQPELQALLAARNTAATVITPHPLEAARLMETGTAAVQSNRLHTAQTLAQKFHCTVVLKGSGTVITAPGAVPAINTTGNGLLATAGTGDVLAGLIGARMASGQSALDAACDSVYLHGQVANTWTRHTLTASALSQAL